MAVEIKSGAGTDLATIDPLSKAIRVTNYASDGHEGLHSLPVALDSNIATALNEFILPSLTADDYKFISIQLTGTWVGTVIFEGSNNNTTFYPIATTDPSANATGQTTATVNRIVKVPVISKYIRARVSAYSSGSISATIFGYLDENSSGLISTLGDITLNPETTKKIGNVGLDAEAVLNDFYVCAVGAVDVNSRTIRAQACVLKSMVMTSLSATARYVKIYDQATAPTAGQSSPTPVLVLAIQAGGELVYPLPLGGMVFDNGISMTMTLGPANSNTTGTSTVDFVLHTLHT
jgi:hypothetical protein